MDTSALNILYLKPRHGEKRGDITQRNLVKNLREDFWIEQSGRAEVRSSWVHFEISCPYSIEHRDLGRNREQPGDGFRWSYNIGTSGTRSRAEWFEVTEVFVTVDPWDVEAFMRLNNGLSAYAGFNPEKFLREIDMGIPPRSVQRLAADKVIDAIDKKFRKLSYEDVSASHGYGTLIVGLPLWFASLPANPLRDANVLDDFMTRVGVALKRYSKSLAKKKIPFWRIVVAWNMSEESLHDSKAKSRMDVYEDPVYRQIGDFPTKGFLIWNLVDLLIDADLKELDSSSSEMHLVQACPTKNKPAMLPASIAEVEANFEETKRHLGLSTRTRLKWRVIQRLLEFITFTKVHGFAGLRRWAAVRLSPRFWIEAWAKLRRQEWLYEESRRRQLGRVSHALQIKRRRRPLILTLLGRPWTPPAPRRSKQTRMYLKLLRYSLWFAVFFWTAHWVSWTIFNQPYVVDELNIIAKITFPLLLVCATFCVWLISRIFKPSQTKPAKSFLRKILVSLSWLIVILGWGYWLIWVFHDIQSDPPAVIAIKKLVLLFILVFGGLGAYATRWAGSRSDESAQTYM